MIGRRGDGSVVPRPNGTFRTSYIDSAGKRRDLYAKTESEVEEKLNRALALRQQLRMPTPARLTVAQYLESWLETTAKSRLRSGTFRDYETIIRVHILPFVGRKRVGQLAPSDVRRLLAEKLNTGLSPRRVQLIHAVLRCALNDGVSDGILSTNPAVLRRAVKVERRKPQAFMVEECKAILAACEGSRLYRLVYAVLSTGLRQGELLGLQWNDVDLENGTVRIWQQLQRGTLVPLNTNSAREQRISEDLAKVLRAHRLKQEPLSPFVFASERGTALDGVNVTHRLQSILRSHGLPAIRFHDLRHSAATLHLRMGASMREVMELLGHSRIGVTMDIYAAVLPDAQRESAERVAAALAQ